VTAALPAAAASSPVVAAPAAVAALNIVPQGTACTAQGDAGEDVVYVDAAFGVVEPDQVQDQADDLVADLVDGVLRFGDRNPDSLRRWHRCLTSTITRTSPSLRPGVNPRRDRTEGDRHPPVADQVITECVAVDEQVLGRQHGSSPAAVADPDDPPRSAETPSRH
jgi:hypothetical protein